GLLRASGIDGAKLPELLPVDAELGEVLPAVAAELGLSSGVVVTAPVNDTCAAGIGCAAFTGDHAGVSIGTTSVMITHVGKQRTDIRNAIVSMPSPLPGVFLVMAENGIGGRALEHFLEKLVFARDGFVDSEASDDHDKFAALHRALAESRPGAGGVLFLPWLSGSLAPAEDGRVRGGFLNMSLDTRRADLAQAVLEGVAFNFRWLREPVEGFVGRRLSHLYFFGGGAKSDHWAQVLADVMQLPVHQAGDPDYVACRGLARLAFHRRGLLSRDELAAPAPAVAIHEPRRELAEGYDRAFVQFRRAFFANRRIFHALND
ncbi:MAG: hypothetical protein KC457_33185, partial [Myxococcales bacterium]|nr:hypothetical protein [Myxococcales bacterium]